MCERVLLTPSQTVGPFLALGLAWNDGPLVVPRGAPGEVTIQGRLLDGHGDPVPDGLVETWQADAEGRFVHPDDPRGSRLPRPEGFRGFGRCPTDREGGWHVRTVKPGPVPGPDGRWQAPHIDVTVFARGLLDRVTTRLYFPDERAANEVDPVLTGVEPARRATLVAVPDGGGLRFDIRLQGDGECVFFDV